MSFFGFDSLDALRASLTARLGGAGASQDSTDTLSPVIGRLLLDEARENERRIAALRALLSMVYLGLAFASTTMGGIPVSRATLFAAGAWCLLSTVLYSLLRRGWYRLWLRRVAPVCDAAAIVAGAALASQGTQASEGTRAALIGTVGLLCGFLVFTGALRLTRMSTQLGSGLAVLAFLGVALIAELSPMPTIGIVSGLLACSVLSGRVTEAIRRVIATEVGRLTMERHVERADARAAEAQAASKAREEVLRIVTHDLRNPLATILMSADLLTEPLVNQEAREKQAGIIKRAGARMNRLIRDLLDVARMDTGRLTVEPKPTAPADLVAHALETMRPLAEEKTLTLVEAVDARLPNVSADAMRINQVFSNLIGNAIKFTPAGGQITLRAELSDGRVWFSVTDTGPGIPSAQLEKVFGQFWQARSSDTRGIGLGLTIAKGIVEAHGGRIGADSEVGVGTKFWFSLNGWQEAATRS